jgi:hypothetical protein
MHAYLGLHCIYDERMLFVRGPNLDSTLTAIRALLEIIACTAVTFIWRQHPTTPKSSSSFSQNHTHRGPVLKASRHFSLSPERAALWALRSSLISGCVFGRRRRPRMRSQYANYTERAARRLTDLDESLESWYFFWGEIRPLNDHGCVLWV